MMKITALSLLAGSAAAFAPAQVAKSSTALSAEKSKALPFMNRPPLVSSLTREEILPQNTLFCAVFKLVS